MIEKVLQDSAALQESVYDMDETGIMLSKLNSIKIFVGKDNKRGYRGACVKRTTITAIECVSAIGRYLNPMTIWSAANSSSQLDHVPHPWMALYIFRHWIYRLISQLAVAEACS